MKKKVLSIITIFTLMTLMLTGCETEAQRVSYKTCIL